MNLHGIVAGAIGAVNPLMNIVIQVSLGSVVDDSGQQVPAYAPPQTVSAQVQPLTGGELRHLDSLNLQGDFEGIYINGQVEGLVRAENKGGDLIYIPSTNRTYLVTTVLESWPDWCKVAATLQSGITIKL